MEKVLAIQITQAGISLLLAVVTIAGMCLALRKPEPKGDQ